MITELDRQHFHKVFLLLESCRNIEARAVACGTNPGAVYADHPESPTAALVWMQGLQGFQLIGDPRSASLSAGLDACMRAHIEPRLAGQRLGTVEIGVDSAVSDQVLSSLFPVRRVQVDRQHVFALKPDHTPVPAQASEVRTLPPRTAIRSMDLALLKSREFADFSFLKQKILACWDSFDAFAEHGFGCLAEQDGRIVSLCFSAFVHGSTHAVDIETAEEYRNSGCGTAVARHYVQECIRRGLRPYWDCTPENAGSIRIAENTGLSPDFDYRVFWYEL
ncbi:GNAT family N-acetyltransferase [Saccharibacillus alkalitolerans]|uniref:GNAT family N-acetyltransferase n=1 Tax=Saccharibacillus alkalitolerans TaxID=2705290 RepID=A0ABX0F9R1_9BACL|nr:GNAT family N-acetyltransferase [Saccharibacillus alkalitolerans]NGZ76680.1 GNAT family N-acetyltransferase [Saccharibacillus alkalitolerans]